MVVLNTPISTPNSAKLNAISRIVKPPNMMASQPANEAIRVKAIPAPATPKATVRFPSLSLKQLLKEL
jgi:hypothetical protein